MRFFFRLWIHHIYQEFFGFSNENNYIIMVKISIVFLIKILWIIILEYKYILGSDSLVIRNFSLSDQGVYYCRAFITLKNNFLTKIYPILVQIQNKTSLLSTNINFLSLENKYCQNLNQTFIRNNTISYCNINGNISNQTCPQNYIWNNDYSQCLSEMSMNNRKYE